nr:hypothetical protein [Acidobacteriota bacterium]
MYFRRFVCLGVLSLAFFTVSHSQTSPTESATEKEKAQKELEKRALEMIDQAVGEANTLKLPANRAIVFALAGDLYWRFDEKRARELFRSAGDDILVANLESEKEKKESDDPYLSFYEYGGVRQQVLPIIAKHD